MNMNPNCDGGRCQNDSGEVRLLPTVGGGNLILCRACYQYEIAYRRDRNRELAASAQFALPFWDVAEVYEGAK